MQCGALLNPIHNSPRQIKWGVESPLPKAGRGSCGGRASVSQIEPTEAKHHRVATAKPHHLGHLRAPQARPCGFQNIQGGKHQLSRDGALTCCRSDSSKVRLSVSSCAPLCCSPNSSRLEGHEESLLPAPKNSRASTRPRGHFPNRGSGSMGFCPTHHTA